VIIVLATAPKVHKLKPDLGQWILRKIIIHSTTSFREEVKLLLPCKILWHVKDPYSMKDILVGKIHIFLAKFLLLHYQVTVRELWGG
jgi:hypothetical protein